MGIGRRTDLGEDLDDSLSRLCTRLEEEEAALAGVLLSLLAGHLAPAFARSGGDVLGGVVIRGGSGGGVVVLLVVVVVVV